MLSLPDPLKAKVRPFTEVLAQRKSTRTFSSKRLSLEQISYVLWACQGKSNIRGRGSGRRTVPSAGATYPLEIFLVCGDGCIEDIDAGIYHYLCDKHAVKQESAKDVRSELAGACFSQRFVAEAPASVVVAADYARTSMSYGERGVRYVHIEVGHAGQNIYLACRALGLATVAVGAFNDEDVARTLELALSADPLYVMPVGYPK
jgi:SagB-type dehydrogenase family enzyme